MPVSTKKSMRSATYLGDEDSFPKSVIAFLATESLALPKPRSGKNSLDMIFLYLVKLRSRPSGVILTS